MMIALGIGVAGACCGVAAIASTGASRLAWAWTSGSCAVATAAYVANRPGWLGKHGGKLRPRAFLILPYLVAFRIACELIRWGRGPGAPTLGAPGPWGGRPVRGRPFSAGGG